MNRNKFKRDIVSNRPWLPKEYDYPMFKLGDIVWILDEDTSTWREFDDGKYQTTRAIVIEGPKDDEDTYDPWRYKVINLDDYEDNDYTDEELEGFEYKIVQTHMFHKLSILKKTVQTMCDFRIQELKDKIQKVNEQNTYIQEQVDVQEHRDEQINILTEDA